MFWNGCDDDDPQNTTNDNDVCPDASYLVTDGSTTTGNDTTVLQLIDMITDDYDETELDGKTFWGPFQKWMMSGHSDDTDDKKQSGQRVHQMRCVNRTYW